MEHSARLAKSSAGHYWAVITVKKIRVAWGRQGTHLPCPAHAKDSSGAEIQEFRNSPTPFHLAFLGASFSIKLVSVLQWFRPTTCLGFTAVTKHSLQACIVLPVLITTFFSFTFSSSCLIHGTAAAGSHKPPSSTSPCGFSLPCAECSSSPFLISHCPLLPTSPIYPNSATGGFSSNSSESSCVFSCESLVHSKGNLRSLTMLLHQLPFFMQSYTGLEDLSSSLFSSFH